MENTTDLSLLFEPTSAIYENKEDASTWAQHAASEVSTWNSTLFALAVGDDRMRRQSGRACKIYTLFFSGVVTLGIVCFGLVGNNITIFTLWPKRLKTSTSFLLIILAFHDDLLLLVSLQNNVIPAICEYLESCTTYMSKTHMILTTYIRPVASTSHLAATWVIVLVTLQRYIGVCYPMKAQTWNRIGKTAAYVAIIHVTSVCYNVVRFFIKYPSTTPSGRTTIVTVGWFDSYWYKYVYNIGLTYLTLYLLPFISLTYMTNKLIKELRRTAAVRHQLTSSKKNERDLTKTLVVVVLVFMICQLCAPIRRLLIAFIPRRRWGNCDEAVYYVQPLMDVTIALNSAANILIYGLCTARFRTTMVSRLQGLSLRSTKITPVTS